MICEAQIEPQNARKLAIQITAAVVPDHLTSEPMHSDKMNCARNTMLLTMAMSVPSPLIWPSTRDSPLSTNCVGNSINSTDVSNLFSDSEITGKVIENPISNQDGQSVTRPNDKPIRQTHLQCSAVINERNCQQKWFHLAGWRFGLSSPYYELKWIHTIPSEW